MVSSRRIASNFAFLSTAELVCRATSVIVTLSLANRLGVVGYGRIEFAFNVVFWLVLLVRDSSDVIVARELSRHPQLIKPLVDHVLALKGLFSLILFAGLALVGTFTLRDSSDRWILTLYGLMLFTTAIGLDFVYRGTERLGLLTVSLCLRTFVYAVGVLVWVGDAQRIVWVPVWLAVGEVSGIALVWLHYLTNYRIPSPRFSPRFLTILMQRGRTVCAIQLSQAVISTADFTVVWLLSSYWDVGRYALPHRLVTAILTFGLIFQQAAFPTLSRLWRHTASAGREALDSLVEALVTVLVPIAVGGTVLAEPLVRLLPEDYAGAGLLLAIGIWRAPFSSWRSCTRRHSSPSIEKASGSARLCWRPSGSGPWSPCSGSPSVCPGRPRPCSCSDSGWWWRGTAASPGKEGSRHGTTIWPGRWWLPWSWSWLASSCSDGMSSSP